MFDLAKEHHVGCEEEIIDAGLVKNSMEQFKYTPFMVPTDVDCPQIQLDEILGKVTESINKLAFDFEFGSVECFLQMVDFAVIDMSILN